MVGRVSKEVPRVTCVHISIYTMESILARVYIYIYSYIHHRVRLPSSVSFETCTWPPPKLCHS